MELVAYDDGVVAADGGSRLGLRCKIPTGKVCHPSIFGATTIELKPQIRVAPWANHGVHLFCLLAWCKGPRTQRGEGSACAGAWAPARAGFAWADMVDPLPDVNSLELIGTWCHF